MTDLIAAALEEFVPPFEGVEGDWKGIAYEAAMAARIAPAARRSPREFVRAWRSQRRRRPLLVAVASLATIAVTTAAIAAGLGAFNGIGAAQHPRAAGDTIDPATAAYIQRNLAGIQLDTARHIGQFADGQHIYVITGTQNDLCTVIGPPHAEWWCGNPLSNSHPATLLAYDEGNNNPKIPWIAFGVALDGVTAISFQPTPTQPKVTVPVKDNLWFYEDQHMPNVLQPVTAHFADGTSVVMPAQGQNCAAC